MEDSRRESKMKKRRVQRVREYSQDNESKLGEKKVEK